tara:strand:- start:428 stop:547 length:120 start_codon:yes stop_codon:yes gene_type:complete
MRLLQQPQTALLFSSIETKYHLLVSFIQTSNEILGLAPA